MKVKCDVFFPGEIVDGALVEQPSQSARGHMEVRLELTGGGGTPIQVPPPAAFGAEVVDATASEWTALEAAGYRLKRIETARPRGARYSFGNPHAPMGIGAYMVELSDDGAVKLVHDRHGKRRVWRARAEPTVWPELLRAIENSGFPHYVGPMSAPPGTASFSFAVTGADGETREVSGFGAIEYRDVNLLFNRIVSQMSKDQVLGLELPSESRYVADVVVEESV